MLTYNDQQLILYQSICEDIRTYVPSKVYNKYLHIWSYHLGIRHKYLAMPKWRQLLIQLRTKLTTQHPQ